MDLVYFLIAFIGIVTGIADGLFGVGGLLAIPLLIMTGLPPHTAVAADRFGVLGSSVAALIRHMRAGNIIRRWLPVLCIMGLLAGVIGANIAVSIEPAMFQSVLGIMILLALPFVAMRGYIGTQDRRAEYSHIRLILGFALTFCALLYGGVVGAGTGTFMILIMSGIMGLTLLQTKATMLVPGLIMNIIGFIIFWRADYIDWPACCAMLIGTIIGGYTGSALAIRLGNTRLKPLLIGICAISAILLIWR
jgi:hypothetical protein